MLTQLLSMLNDSVWAFNLDKGEYAFISPDISHILGVGADELMADKQLWQKIIIPDDRATIVQITQNIRNGEQAELFYRVNPNGEIKWLSEKKSRFIDPATGNQMLLGVIRDVSDQKATSFHLKNVIGDFGVLFEKSPNPMWIYETPSLRILKVNEAAIAQYGYSEDECLTLTIRDIRPKIDLAKFNEYIFRKEIANRAVDDNTGVLWKHINKNGDLIHAEITGHEMKYRNTTCRLIIATDISRRVLHQQGDGRQQQLNTNG